MRIPHRIRLIASAALCGLLALTSSCQKEQLSPQPDAGISSTISEEVQRAKQAFAASGYEPKLVETWGQQSNEKWQWEPQWQHAFKARADIYVPLMYKTTKHGLQHMSNAKRFLVVGPSSTTIATYVYPTAQKAELAENSPAALQDFTGQLAQLNLATNRLRVGTYTKGLRPYTQAKDSKSANKTACERMYECRWETRCADHTYVSMITVGLGECKEPKNEPCQSGPRTWNIIGYSITSTCPGDNNPDEPELIFPDGWYKVTAMHSGLVMGVMGGSVSPGAKLCQWYDTGAPDQKYYLRGQGMNQYYESVYSFLPGSNYLAGLNMVVGVIGPNGGSTQAGTRLTVDHNLGLNSQKWSLAPLNYQQGYFTFRVQNHSSWQVMDVTNNSYTAGTEIAQWPWNNTRYDAITHQVFKFTPTTL